MDLNLVLRIIFLVILLAFISYGFFNRKTSNKQTLKSVLLWLLILVSLIMLYAFRFELVKLKDRLLSVLVPNYQFENIAGELTIARNHDGHFYLDSYIENNQSIHFLVDTGASDVALTPEDAKKLGFDLSKLNYNKRYYTANGVIFAAPVIIKQLPIGKKIFYNIKASISTGGLDVSLLGMSLIQKFSRFRINDDFLILTY